MQKKSFFYHLECLIFISKSIIVLPEYFIEKGEGERTGGLQGEKKIDLIFIVIINICYFCILLNNFVVVVKMKYNEIVD